MEKLVRVLFVVENVRATINDCDGQAVQVDKKSLHQYCCSVRVVRMGAFSAECGTRLMVRERNEPCNRREEQMTKCRVRDCPYYGIWSAWSECAVSCGTGLISRSRTCDNGVAGIDCVGDKYQQSECYATEKGFTMWSDWTECTATCGAV